MGNAWVYEKRTGKWMVDFRDASVYLVPKQTAYGLADFGEDARPPDPITERFAETPSRRRPATADEQRESLIERTQLEAAQLGAQPAYRALIIAVAGILKVDPAALTKAAHAAITDIVTEATRG